MPAWHPTTNLSSTACLRQTAVEVVRASHAWLQQQALMLLRQRLTMELRLADVDPGGMGC